MTVKYDPDTNTLKVTDDDGLDNFDFSIPQDTFSINNGTSSSIFDNGMLTTGIPNITITPNTGMYQSPTWGNISNPITVNSPTWSYPFVNDTITIGNVRPSLHVEGDADFKGDIKFDGKSLKDVLDNLERRLAILHPNPKLEEKWEELKALGDRYRELEKEILEKEKMWAILKK